MKPVRASHSSRCSQPLSTNQTPHPTTKAGQQPEPPTPTPTGRNLPATLVLRAGIHPHRGRSAGLLPQDPTVCLAVSFRRPESRRTEQRSLCTRTTPTTGAAHLHESLSSPNPHRMWAGHKSRGAP
jgi:hypothetical protein